MQDFPCDLCHPRQTGEIYVRVRRRHLLQGRGILGAVRLRAFVLLDFVWGEMYLLVEGKEEFLHLVRHLVVFCHSVVVAEVRQRHRYSVPEIGLVITVITCLAPCLVSSDCLFRLGEMRQDISSVRHNVPITLPRIARPFCSFHFHSAHIDPFQYLIARLNSVEKGLPGCQKILLEGTLHSWCCWSRLILAVKQVDRGSWDCLSYMADRYISKYQTIRCLLLQKQAIRDHFFHSL